MRVCLCVKVCVCVCVCLFVCVCVCICMSVSVPVSVSVSVCLFLWVYGYVSFHVCGSVGRWVCLSARVCVMCVYVCMSMHECMRRYVYNPLTSVSITRNVTWFQRKPYPDYFILLVWGDYD